MDSRIVILAALCLATFVGATIGWLAAWAKMQPQLERATKELDLSAEAGSVLAEALELLKTKHPCVWDDIKPIIETASKPVSEMENAIRGFRGLPLTGSA